VDLSLPLTKIKKELYFLGLQTKANFLFVTGLQDQLTRQEAKMIRLYHTGIKKETIGQLLL